MTYKYTQVIASEGGTKFMRVAVATDNDILANLTKNGLNPDLGTDTTINTDGTTTELVFDCKTMDQYVDVIESITATLLSTKSES